MSLQRPLQLARMVVNPKLALDQGGDAPEGPALGGKARRHGTLIQEPAQTSPGLRIQARLSCCSDAGGQSAPALLSQGGGLTGDTGATNAQLPGNVCLGEPALPQQSRGRRTALLHLFRR